LGGIAKQNSITPDASTGVADPRSSAALHFTQPQFHRQSRSMNKGRVMALGVSASLAVARHSIKIRSGSSDPELFHRKTAGFYENGPCTQAFDAPSALAQAGAQGTDDQCLWD
jgi:hypothetical protein